MSRDMSRDVLMLGIRNRTRGTVLADRAGIADSTWTRLVGLLNRPALSSGEGLWLTPTSSIHTVGMRFPIDAVFLGPMRTEPEKRRACRVERIYRALGPWRVTRYVWGSERALELPAGVIAASRTEVGGELEFQRA